MGYRSVVGIKCEEKAFEKFKSAYEEQSFTPDKIYHNNENDEFILVWDWVKWYDDFEEVQAIENVMDELDEYDIDKSTSDGMGYKMIRLGESDEDVEERDNSSDLEFYYIRQLDTDGFALEKE